MTAYSTPTLIYLGKVATTDPFEGDYHSEYADSLVGLTRSYDEMNLVTVEVFDKDHDGVMEDDEYNPNGDFVTYDAGAGSTSQYTDSTMTAMADVTLSDGSVISVKVVVVQMQNGDLFISDLLNSGTLDNLEISAVEITEITGDTASGWFTNQSVDNTTLVAPYGSELDGIVEGTDGADVIDTAYTGDPDGDMVDARDAILPGEAPNDDIIVAGAGNDTVLAGEGDDEVYAGSGDDYVEGGAGNDEIHGDSDGGYATGATAVREVLQWDQAPYYADERDAGAFTQNTGTVDVSFKVLSGSSDAQVEYEDGAGNVSGIDTGTLGAVDPNSGLALEGDDKYDDASVQLTFSDEVENVQFRINDIDYDSSVKVLAFDADGNAVEVTLSGGSAINITDGTAYATGSGLEPTADANSMLVEIAGPVAEIRVIHDITGYDTSHIQLTDVYFDAMTGAVDPTSEPGDDVLLGGAGEDLIFGDGGNDTIEGGEGDDVLYGDSGTAGGTVTADLIVNGSFEDTSGMTTTSYGYVSTGSMVGWSTLDPTDEIDVHNDERGSVEPADGNNWLDLEASPGDITVYQDVEGAIDGESYTLTFSAGDSIDVANNYFDVYWGGVKIATINPPDGTMQDYTFTVEGGAGDGSDRLMFVGHGPDDNFGVSIDAVSLTGPTLVDGATGVPGDDIIIGGEGADVIYGEGGNDLIDGGAGADVMSGGDDRDTFINVTSGDVIDGGEGGDDWDTLDLTGSASEGGSLKVTYTTPDRESGYVTYKDADGNDEGTLTFKNIENIVPCFTPGTMIATPKGEVPIETLREGDRIITRDNGIQEIRWVGRKDIGFRELAKAGHLKPVLIRAGSLGNGLPERDMFLSPNHRVLVANDQTALYFDEREVLAAAKHLVGNPGVHFVEPMGVSYIHFMFDHHEVVLSNGAWTESFQPGDYSLQGIGNAQRQELFELFPELATHEGIEDFAAARRILKKHEAQLLFKG